MSMHSDSDAAARRERNLATLRSMLAAVSAGDPAAYLAHVADGVVYEAPYYADLPAVCGREGLAAMLDAVRERFSSVRYDVVDHFPTVDPDLVIAELRGDNQVAKSSVRYRNHYLMFVRFRDGKVAHWREFSNPDVYRRATGE